MFVAQVVMPASRRESWTVLGEDGAPVEPVERYLAFLTDVDALLRFCRRLLPVGYQRGAIAAAEWRPLVAVLRAASASVFTAPDLAERIGHRRWPARLALWRATASLLGKRAKRIGRRAAPVLTP